MKRLILLSVLAAAGMVAACSPGTDDGAVDETFPVESFPVESFPVETTGPSEMPSVDASLEPTTIP